MTHLFCSPHWTKIVTQKYKAIINGGYVSYQTESELDIGVNTCMGDWISRESETFLYQERSSWMFKLAFGAAAVLFLGAAILVGLSFSLKTNVTLVGIAFLAAWISKKLRIRPAQIPPQRVNNI